MSIHSMTDNALVRREGTTVDETAASANSGVAAAVKTIANYIPAEVLTVYLAVVAALADKQQSPASQSGYLDKTSVSWGIFWFFLVFTPATVWLLYAAKLRNLNKPLPASPHDWPLWAMVSATIAYAVWAFALPNTPFSGFRWYSSAIAGILVLLVSVILGYVAPVVTKRQVDLGTATGS